MGYTSLILDGVCRYLGPAVIFSSDYDLAGALALSYGDQSLQANIVNPSLELGESNLSLTDDNDTVDRYAYGEKLIVYHFARKATYRLTDAATARGYFQTFNPDYGSSCPPQRAVFEVTHF